MQNELKLTKKENVAESFCRVWSVSNDLAEIPAVFFKFYVLLGIEIGI